MKVNKFLIGTFILVVSLFFAAGIKSINAQTADGTFTLTAPSSNIEKGTVGMVVLTVASEQIINAVQATISYPKSKLTFEKIDTGGSPFGTIAKGSGAAGTINIAQGTTTPVSGVNKVATITFLAKETTSLSEITFGSPTLIASAATHTNIFGGTTYHKVQGITNQKVKQVVAVPTRYLPPDVSRKRAKTPFYERFVWFVFSIFGIHK